MFKRKSPTPPRIVGPSNTLPPGVDPTGAFRFAESTTEYPFMHPTFSRVYAFFTFQDGGRITIATPLVPAEHSPRFALADLPHNEWVQLQDAHGRPLPIAVLVDDLGASGRWL